MVRNINNESESNSTSNLTAGQGVKIEGNEIKIDASSVTLDTETQQLQTQVTSIQSTANIANSKADLLGTVQSGLVNNMNVVLPYYDTLYKTTIFAYVTSRQNSQTLFHDKSAIWTNTKTSAVNQILPNGVYQLKLVTGASENLRLWEVMGICHFVKNSNINDPDYLPETETELTYFCHRNEISTDPVMKIHIIRKFGDPVVGATMTRIRFSGVPEEKESITPMYFTMRKIFDLYD